MKAYCSKCKRKCFIRKTETIRLRNGKDSTKGVCGGYVDKHIWYDGCGQSLIKKGIITN